MIQLTPGKAATAYAAGPTTDAFPTSFTHEFSTLLDFAPIAARIDSFSSPDTLAADHLESLAEEITSLAASIDIATHRMLTLLAEFDEKRGWEREGHRSCAHWLAYRTGMDRGAARERVRTARALAGLPEIGAAMERGDLSFSKVRALTRVATPEDEGELLAFALESSTATVERVVRGWKKRSRMEEAEWDRYRHESRSLSVVVDDEGMYVVRGKLEPEVGALLMRAIEAASDALYRKDVRGEAARRALIGTEASEREAARRRADAMGLISERAMSAGFAGDPNEEADISGTRAERYQVVLHVETATLAESGETGRSDLDVTGVSAETSRRLSCDASVVVVTHGRGVTEGAGITGPILNVGRRTRTISPGLRRALEIRDRGCRFPGCGLRFTDAHHVQHWADGGETSLSNTLLLCRFHHRLVHEGGWKVRWSGEGEPVFHDPRGGTHFKGRRALRKNEPSGGRAGEESRGGEPGRRAGEESRGGAPSQCALSPAPGMSRRGCAGGTTSGDESDEGVATPRVPASAPVPVLAPFPIGRATRTSPRISAGSKGR